MKDFIFIIFVIKKLQLFCTNYNYFDFSYNYKLRKHNGIYSKTISKVLNGTKCLVCTRRSARAQKSSVASYLFYVCVLLYRYNT